MCGICLHLMQTCSCFFSCCPCSTDVICVYLQLERNSITLLLANYYDDQEGDDDEAALTRPATKVSRLL